METPASQRSTMFPWPNYWQNGPLPPNTYQWGGVTLEKDASGFYRADFCGDHAMVECGGGGKPPVRKEPHEIITWNNSLTCPPQPEK